MRVVVTGGAGFIGANLVRILAARPEVGDIVVVDDLSTGDKENLAGSDALFVEGSVLDPALLDQAFARADAIVHLAALVSVPRSLADPAATHLVNATGTLQVLEAARRSGGPLVVVASSSSVYGAQPVLPKHERLRCVPVSPYAVSKLATEAYASAYAHCFGLPVLPFRFFNVFGPLQRAGHPYAAVVPRFVAAAVEGRPLTVYGDGRQTRDFTYVGSLCAVIAEAVLRGVTSPEPVNLAFGTRTTLRGLIDEIERALGHPVAVEHHEPRLGDVHDSQADTTRLSALFPEARPVPLAEGLRSTVEWFRDEYTLAASAPRSGTAAR